MDAAFTDLAEELGVGIPELLEKPKLRDILLYHVLPEVLREEVLLPASISFFFYNKLSTMHSRVNISHVWQSVS
ncbi:MAG: hypothetical protein L7V85_08305 [Bacteroidia bacterium]|nr:hypothetical protein [Bacteroidia bacterium]